MQGGTAAEVWIPQERVSRTPETEAVLKSRICPWWPVEPGTLYNSMIHPLLPYRIAGAIWYQGESNRDYPQNYTALMKELIASWRTGFGQDFPFYLVQIAPYNYQSANNGPALVREAQEQVAREVPRTGMVVTNDIGDYGNIHPARKQEAGIRLANLALGETYGKRDKGYQSPTLESMEIRKDRAVLRFHHADSGLVCKGKTPEGLAIAGEDGVFVPAKARIIQGNMLEVYSPKVKHPVAVRYCFDDATVGNLFNTFNIIDNDMLRIHIRIAFARPYIMNVQHITDCMILIKVNNEIVAAGQVSDMKSMGLRAVRIIIVNKVNCTVITADTRHPALTRYFPICAV